jgi:hypothetical protein
MAFFGVLPEIPSFGSQFAKSIGAGVSKGVDLAAQLAGQSLMEQMKLSQKQKLIQSVKDKYETKKFGNSDGEGPSSDIDKKIKDLKGLSPSQEQTSGEVGDTELQKAEDFYTVGLDELGRFETEKAKLKSKQAAAKDKAKEASIDRSYEFNKDFIKSTTDSYKSFESDLKPRLMQLQNLNNEQLISPSSAKFLEIMNLPLGMLENPSNELYEKVSQDLLKGLPETYGNRILKVEVENYLKTIPRLVNSPEGRRMIASNALKLGEIKQAFYNEMRNVQQTAIDKNERLPRDFEQKVFENSLPRVQKLTKQFTELSSIKSVPKGTVPFFNPQGTVSFVPNDPEAMKWAEQNGGERVW